MKLSTREDIRAPRDYVFRRVADFAALEGMIDARGVTLTTTAPGAASGLGRCWRAAFEWKGRDFATLAEVVRVDVGEGYTIQSETGGVTCLALVDLEEVTAERTRLMASLDFRPTTLSSRLLLQSLKLAKPRLSQKFAERVAKVALGIQRSHDA